MLEKHIPRPESQEHIHNNHEVHRAHEQQKTTHEKPAEQLDSLESIRRSIDNESKSSKHIESVLDRQDQPEQSTPTLVNKDLKNIAFNRVMKRTQRHLKPHERNFSKFIHKPSIDKVSEFGSKTLARPSGIVGGAALALLGSSVLLYLSKHYGFEYNNLLFLILFGVGFVLTVSIELLINAFRSKAY
jgi:hypothetical protein